MLLRTPGASSQVKGPSWRRQRAEVMGHYLNHADQGERIRQVLQIVSSGTRRALPKTTMKVYRRLRPEGVDANDVIRLRSTASGPLPPPVRRCAGELPAQPAPVAERPGPGADWSRQPRGFPLGLGQPLARALGGDAKLAAQVGVPVVLAQKTTLKPPPPSRFISSPDGAVGTSPAWRQRKNLATSPRWSVRAWARAP